MTVLARERAYAKVNLCLYLGPARPHDGRHGLVTMFDAVGLADELEVTTAVRDEVVCDGVTGPNLVDDALAALRAAGWRAPPVRVTITKRIPIAAGMGGGSADAAAMLRCAPRLAPLPEARLGRIAGRLGADVPSQLAPGPCLGVGAGETLLPAPPLEPYGAVVLPQPFPLSTAGVYREADRLGLGRSGLELAALRDQLTTELRREHVVNDLQPAALSLHPEIAGALDDAIGAGADQAIVCGSGPTVIGLYWGDRGPGRARAAVRALLGRHPAAAAVAPVRKGVQASMANE
jgi:4-diphosphocytidyl-2-C-methyl-D-erythritol kinase